jgi:hypothetical protein
MSLIGWIGTALVAIVVAAGALVVLTALPDLNRYRRLRKM